MLVIWGIFNIFAINFINRNCISLTPPYLLTYRILMNPSLHTRAFLFALLFSAILSSCKKNHDTAESTADSIVFDSTDRLPVEQPDTVKVEEEKDIPDFEGSNEVVEYINSLPDADMYRGGAIMSAAHHAPEYAEKLLKSKYSKFIVVDKASMRVILYDKYGQILKAYDMACAKNYGTKHKKADSRTPEGFFSVEGIYDSTDWLFTDDNGRTSKKKGQFGPRFIRLRIPNTSQIGIHGTCSPWSMGHRASHGCIRILNENILELVDLVEIGMPVIVLPGKRDRAVNREEGYHIAYFPTDTKYAMSEAEKNAKVKKPEEISKTDSIKSDETEQITDSVSGNIEPVAPVNPETTEKPDSISF